MEAMALRKPVDDLDQVTVNADDPSLRENRLALLSQIGATGTGSGFSVIEG